MKHSKKMGIPKNAFKAQVQAQGLKNLRDKED
jgi:hypothetical protein